MLTPISSVYFDLFVYLDALVHQNQFAHLDASVNFKTSFCLDASDLGLNTLLSIRIRFEDSYQY